MPVYKYVLFGDTNCRGYSEIWYRDRAGAAPLETIFNEAEQLFVKRASMLGADSRITAVRVSNADDELGTGDTARGDARLFRKGYGGDPQFRSASPDLAAIVTVYDSTGIRKRNTFMRGFFDDLEVNGGLQTIVGPGAVWNTRLTEFLTECRNLNVGWLSRRVKQAGGGVEGQVAVDGYQPNALFPTKVQVNLAGNLFSAAEVAAQRPIGVTFSGVNGRGGSRLNGPQVLIPLSQSTAFTVDPMALLPFAGGGVATRFTYQFVPLVEGRIAKIGRRAAGNVSNNSRGRSRVGPKG